MTDDEYAAALARVNPERRAKAERYRRPMDRRLCVCAELLLQQAVAGREGAAPLPSAGREGAAPLPSAGREGAAPLLHSNISHTDGIVVCAVAPTVIGVDVEAVGDDVDQDLREALFAFFGNEGGRENAPPLRQLIVEWTRREACWKMHNAPEPPPNPCLTTLDRGAYVVSVCTPSPLPIEIIDTPSILTDR